MTRDEIRSGKMPLVDDFQFSIRHAVTDRQSHVQEIDLHTHREFELYLNLAGDISFLAENRLYPLTRGDVFLARPGEHHHCVYRSDAPHEYFWILFECESNRALLEFLFEDPSLNFISPAEELKAELIDLCFSLSGRDPSDENRFFSFFRLLHILKISAHNPLRPQHALPEDLTRLLSYIEEHLSEPISVAAIAKTLYISESTVERRFKEHLDMTPLDYIRKRKLQRAAQLLRDGSSVLQAGLAAGYADNSHFIKLFRQHYGITPHHYKKRFEFT